MPTISSNPSKNKSGGSEKPDSSSETSPGKRGISLEVPAFPELSSARKKELAAFLKAVGIRFKSFELLNLSFIHRSMTNESGYRCNNERLEFLGDSILGAATATLLYQGLADRSEGDLAKIKSVVVSEDILAGVARELQLDGLLILGHGEELSGGRTKNAILADALEALIGALYLDSGYKAAFNFIRHRMGPEITRVLDNRHYRDYKSLLQELTQGLYRNYPVYRVLKRSGPEHDRFFWIEVSVEGKTFGPGMGRNKKAAEQEAARIAYEEIGDTKTPADSSKD
ncbi:ribonuclease III [Treponema primitia ZAS-2]|uniref:Ribonuclease 3 n=2 Tax=Treponema primitia TaxID=88058 RepID=F5YR47_TREPZ|nr:ribonuclease III [Treponema primitia ZAS-2]